jgi:pimeloyl-ACP methyl ester carboxylesterase
MKHTFRTVATVIIALTPTRSADGQSGQRFDSGGVSIHYLDSGTGPAVVVMHGFGGTLSNWQALTRRLVENGFRVIAYDARGHGESGKPTAVGQYGEHDVDDVFRLLGHLKIRRAHLVGYSRGALIAARAATRRPDRVNSLVVGGWGPGNPVDTLERATCEETADMIQRGEPPVALLQALTPKGADGVSATPSRMQQRSRETRMALAAAFRAGCATEGVTTASLGRAGVPLAAVVGSADPMAESVRRMSSQVEGVELTIIPDATHLTAPLAPEFVPAISEFLSKHRGRSGGG